MPRWDVAQEQTFMKKTLFSLGLCLLGSISSLQAQNEDRLRIGIEVGLTINNFTNSDRICTAGGLVGVRGEYDYNKNLYFSGGLRYVSKGADCLDGYDGAPDESFTPSYIEIPLAVGVYKQFNPRLRLFAETGPYFAFGVGGRYSGSSADVGPGYYHEWDYRFFSKKSGNPRRFDPGWGARAGFRFKHFSMSLGYEIGFRTIWKPTSASSDRYDYRNSSFSVSFAYLFY